MSVLELGSGEVRELPAGVVHLVTADDVLADGEWCGVYLALCGALVPASGRCWARGVRLGSPISGPRARLPVANWPHPVRGWGEPDRVRQSPDPVTLVADWI